MATRIEKKIECDDKGCRRRTGVKKYIYTIQEVRAVSNDSDKVIVKMLVEHCPYHLALNVRRLQQSATNTKEYPTDPGDS